MSDLPGICCGLCRIGCFQAYQACCCIKEAPPNPTYNIICLGISNAGKTTLLTILKFENPDAVVPTIGFSVQDILLPNATLKVKELGEEMKETREELHKALRDPHLSSVPWLILCNKQDVDGTVTEDRAFEELSLADVTREHQDLRLSSSSKSDRDSLHVVMEEFASKLNKLYRPHTQDEATEPMTSI